MKIKDFKILTERNLTTKYTNLFLNRYKAKGLDYGVMDYIMRTILGSGTIAGFKLKTNELVSAAGFAPYVSVGFDWKNQPIKAQLIKIHNSPLIPDKILTVGEDVVLLSLGFVPIDFIREYVQRLVDIESTIRTNLKINKMPFVISSIDTKTLNAITQLLEDEEVIVVKDNQIKVMNANAPYIIDKLQQYKLDVESELLTILDIDNVKFEKKAQMNVDEINANNDEINAYSNIIGGRIEAFFDELNKVFGFNIEIEDGREDIQSTQEDINEAKGGNEDDYDE